METPTTEPEGNTGRRPSGGFMTPRLQEAKRKFLWSMVALVVVWVVFAQFLPRALNLSPPNSSTQSSVHTYPSAPASSPPAPPVAGDDSRIRELEARLAALEAQESGPGAAQADALHALEARLQEQDEQLKKLESSIGSREEAAWKTVALWQAFDELSRQVESGSPFFETLQRLEALAYDDAGLQRALEPLKPYAAEGVATITFLRDNFSDVIPEALRLSAQPAAEDGLMRHVAYNLSTLVTVRKTGALEGGTPEAVIARAEASLRDGQIEPALQEVSSLTEPASQAFAAWLAHAQGYIASRAAVDGLRDALALRTQAQAAAP